VSVRRARRLRGLIILVLEQQLVSEQRLSARTLSDRPRS
jgi:hypothetical protein